MKCACEILPGKSCRHQADLGAEGGSYRAGKTAAANGGGAGALCAAKMAIGLLQIMTASQAAMARASELGASNLIQPGPELIQIDRQEDQKPAVDSFRHWRRRAA